MDQSDMDGDGLGDECDTDSDGDGVDDSTDLCLHVYDGRRILQLIGLLHAG